MTQPTTEAYEAASTAWLESDGGAKEAVRAVVDAVWPLAVAQGRRLEAERLAPLVEAAKAWRARFAHDVKDYKGILLASEQDLVAAVDALTRGDTDNE